MQDTASPLPDSFPVIRVMTFLSHFQILFDFIIALCEPEYNEFLLLAHKVFLCRPKILTRLKETDRYCFVWYGYRSL